MPCKFSLQITSTCSPGPPLSLASGLKSREEYHMRFTTSGAHLQFGLKTAFVAMVKNCTNLRGFIIALSLEMLLNQDFTYVPFYLFV